ncbi:toll-like receptor 12 [Phodopus roborovskii]|uniref:Tlr12 protein n=1 Tax=Phodopus roborovskii TaxID=109678 RepID=A0AAU9ZDZ6_PHORO|nr:toll-like receptor 12 [Phodopus roborovskii]CAH6790896.1 Tlr12 [Phodopus roborovskii]
MGWHVLLPGLLLSLPVVTGWTTSKCLLTEGSQLPLVSRYFSFCSVSPLSLLAACNSVKNLTETLADVPQTVEGLCLGGTVSSLPPDAFSAFPGLKILGLNLHLSRLQPGALRGLGQLQKLSFLDHPFGKQSLFIPPDAFGDLISLQRLHISGPCLDKKAGIQLPHSLQWLAVVFSCLQDVGQLAGMFPDLAQGSSSSRDPWALHMLDLSFNQGLKMASPGSLQGLQLDTLKLDQTPLEASRVRALGLQKLDVLSATFTAVTELPAEAVAHFELQELNVGKNKIGSISQEALASCHSLKTLNLQSTGLTKLPPGFLAAMPRLQRLYLAGNRLQSKTLCMNETGDVSGLMTLDLAANGLGSLPPATFSCLPHLRELLLQDNQLLSLEGQLFQGLQQLETLNLDKNPLFNLGKNWLAALPALTTLSLLDTQLPLSPDLGFWGAKSLHNLRLKLPSVPAPAVLSLPMNLISLELQAASGMKHWGLSPNVFPSLETLTIKGRGLKLEVQNASEVFPALQQLSLLQNSLEAFCSQDTSNIFLWQLPKLQTLKIWGAGSNSRPCLITGLPSLQELKLEALQSIIQPRSVHLEELLGELPQLRALQLSDTGLRSLSAAAFQKLGRLQAFALYNEKDLVLHDSLREYSPQMPQYIYILQSNLACQCANAWMEPWVKQSTKTYIYILGNKLCPAEEGGPGKHTLFSFLRDHCPQSLELKLFLASSFLVFLMIALPLLQEARSLWIPFLKALFRVWLQGWRGQEDEGKRFLFDVFVSHCRQDQGWVIEELLPVLEGFLPAGPGLRLCLPDRDFEPGKDVVENVVDSMVSSRVIFCVLSGQALCDPRCRLELHLATSLFLAAPFPPVLLLAFLEPISRHQLPGYHRLARLLRRGDYCLWPKEDEKKAGFWAWLKSRLGQPGLEQGGACGF